MRLVEEHGVTSVAFPAISAGTYGYPIEQAAHVALKVTLAHVRDGSKLRRILFVLFGEEDLEVYRRTLADVLAA